MKSILCLVLILLYAAGMICLILNAFTLGMFLWTVSLLGSIAVLYIHRVNKEREEEAQKRDSEDADKCE